jgi:acyl carrier protein
MRMVSLDELKAIVAGILQIGNSLDGMGPDAALLGGIPEFDSMAVVSILTALEDNYGMIIDDDDVTAENFETLGALLAFVNESLG